jgi:hypothetical protein
MRFLRILVAALVASLGFASSVAAVPLPDSTTAIYTYDASWHVTPLLSAATERGPPADEDTDTTPDAVDGRSHGASTRRQARELLTSTTYDASRSLVQVDRGTATTQGRAEAGDRDLRPLLGAMVAAKFGDGLIGPGPFAGKSIPARGPARDFTRAERDAINDIGRPRDAIGAAPRPRAPSRATSYPTISCRTR